MHSYTQIYGIYIHKAYKTLFTRLFKLKYFHLWWIFAVNLAKPEYVSQNSIDILHEIWKKSGWKQQPLLYTLKVGAGTRCCCNPHVLLLICSSYFSKSCPGSCATLWRRTPASSAAFPSHQWSEGPEDRERQCRFQFVFMGCRSPWELLFVLLPTFIVSPSRLPALLTSGPAADVTALHRLFNQLPELHKVKCL